MKDKGFLSRSFIIVLVAIVGSFVLAHCLEDSSIATIIIPVAVTNWFGGKAFQGFQNKGNGQ